MGTPSYLPQLREFASHLQQLQGALNDLTEEHSKASREWVEKQAHLEKELSTAMHDKVTHLLRGVRTTVLTTCSKLNSIYHYFVGPLGSKLTPLQILIVCCNGKIVG